MAQKLQISQLPPELLEEIFFNVCCDANDHTFSAESTTEWTNARTFIPNYHSPAGPFSISHVNRQWRNIAINLPRLWTHLRIIEPRTEAISWLAEEWVGRAGSLPLYLSLHSYQQTPSLDTWRVYCDNFHRCLSFELEIPMVTDVIAVPSQGTSQHNLKLAKIRIHHPSIHSNNWRFRSNFSFHSSTLSSLIWDVPSLSRLMTNISQPWANLTELGLLRLTYRLPNWISVLSECTNLMKLVLSMNSTWLPIGIFEPTTMSQLTFLSVQVDSKFIEGGRLFTFLTVPSLLELEIITASPIILTSVVDMLQRSEPRLKKLKLDTKESKRTSPTDWPFAQALTLPCFQELRELEGKGYSWTATRNTLMDRVPVEDAETSSAPIDSTGPPLGAPRSICRYLRHLKRVSLIEYREKHIECNLQHSWVTSDQQDFV